MVGYGDYAFAGDGDDVVTVGDGGGNAVGGEGADTLNGGAGNDSLFSNRGHGLMDWYRGDSLPDDGDADVLNGDAGADTLHFSTGDTASGGADRDTFRVDMAGALEGDVPAVILDYEPGETIQFVNQGGNVPVIVEDEGDALYYVGDQIVLIVRDAAPYLVPEET